MALLTQYRVDARGAVHSFGSQYVEASGTDAGRKLGALSYVVSRRGELLGISESFIDQPSNVTVAMA